MDPLIFSERIETIHFDTETSNFSENKMRLLFAISILSLSTATAFSAYGRGTDNAFFRLQLTSPISLTDGIEEGEEAPGDDEISISVPSATDGHVNGRIDGALDIPVLVSGIDETYTVTVADLPGAFWAPNATAYGSGSLIWTPGTTGNWAPLIEVRNADDNLVASQELELSIHGMLAASTAETVYEAEVGDELMITPALNNAIGNVFWGATPSPLPAWLELDDVTGNIDVDTSSPNAIEAVVLTAVDQFDLATASSTPFSIEVLPPPDTTPPVWVTGSTLPEATEGEPYTASVEATDDSGTVTYSLEGSPPAWLALNEETGALSGTPDTAGTVTVMIRAEDPSGNASSTPFSIEVLPPPDTTPPVWVTDPVLPEEIIGQTFRYTLLATDENGPVTYELLDPEIDWVWIDAEGVLDGWAPNMSMTYYIPVRATDAAGNYADRTFSIFISCGGVGACP